MHYGEIKNNDIANGEGVRVTLFVSGCTNRCKNCFQPQTWDFEYGQPFTAETEEKILSMLAPSYIAGLTVQSAGVGALPPPCAGGLSRQKYLELDGIYMGAAPYRGQPLPL